MKKIVILNYDIAIMNYALSIMHYALVKDFAF